MNLKNKLLIIIGSAVVGALNGCSIVWPDQVTIYSGASILVATIIATITGISISKGE